MRDAISKIQTQENYRANKLVSYTHVARNTVRNQEETAEQSTRDLRSMSTYHNLWLYLNVDSKEILRQTHKREYQPGNDDLKDCYYFQVC